MNLYQALNQSYRDFKNNELKTLKESEDKKKKEIEEAGANLDISAGVDIPDDLASGIGMALLASEDEKKECDSKDKKECDSKDKKECDSKDVKESDEKDLDEEAKGLEDQLKQTTDPKEKKEIQARLDEIKKLLTKECDAPEKKEGEEVKEAETTIEVPVKVEVAGTEVVNPEVTPEAPIEEPVEEVTEETTDEIIDDSEKANFDKAIGLLNEVLETINVEGSIDTELCKNKIQNAISALNTHAEDDDFIEGENCEDCKEGEEKECDTIKEAEVKAFKVTRIAPSKNAFMIEAETTEGLKYFIGKNYDKESHTLDEAEEFTDKAKASDHFKSLLK